MGTKGKSGTAEENQRLKDFVVRNVSIVRAAALKRSRVSVRTQARTLGTPFPRMLAYRKKLAAQSEAGLER